jgi:hypothetical protein
VLSSVQLGADQFYTIFVSLATKLEGPNGYICGGTEIQEDKQKAVRNYQC